MASVPPVEAVMEPINKLSPGFVLLLYSLTVPVFFAMDMLSPGCDVAPRRQRLIHSRSKRANCMLNCPRPWVRLRSSVA